jgi:hypothetical protein
MDILLNSAHRMSCGGTHTNAVQHCPTTPIISPHARIKRQPFFLLDFAIANGHFINFAHTVSFGGTHADTVQHYPAIR